MYCRDIATNNRVIKVFFPLFEIKTAPRGAPIITTGNETIRNSNASSWIPPKNQNLITKHATEFMAITTTDVGVAILIEVPR